MRERRGYMRRIGMALSVLFGICTLVFSAGCGARSAENKENTARYQVFFLNKDETKLFSEAVSVEQGDAAAELSRLIEAMKKKPQDIHAHAAFEYEYEIRSIILGGEQVILNLDERYLRIKPTAEILIRAAIVRTLTQVPGVNSVVFQIEGEPLTDSRGNPYEAFSADQFEEF